jgi:predicted SAM-dependent methyltransferase
VKRDLRRAARVVARDVLTGVLRPVAARRFGQAVARQQGPIRLNVGAGPAPLAGWINTDANWRNPLYLDISKPWPVPAGRISHVYADNVIEHFPLAVGREVLANAFAALRPGGWIRLATPDVERTARIYLDDPSLCRLHMKFLAEEGFTVTHPVDLLRVTFAECDHQGGYLYDFASLAQELAAAGFIDVRRAETGASEEPAFEGLERRTSETCVATQLVVEGRKPSTEVSETQGRD